MTYFDENLCQDFAIIPSSMDQILARPSRLQNGPQIFNWTDIQWLGCHDRPGSQLQAWTCESGNRSA